VLGELANHVAEHVGGSDGETKPDEDAQTREGGRGDGHGRGANLLRLHPFANLLRYRDDLPDPG
jgi:hypothetical protein